MYIKNSDILNAQGIEHWHAYKQKQGILLRAQEVGELTALEKGSVTEAMFYVQHSYTSVHTHIALTSCYAVLLGVTIPLERQCVYVCVSSVENLF